MPAILDLRACLRAFSPGACVRALFAATCLACGARLPLGDDGGWCCVCLAGVIGVGRVLSGQGTQPDRSGQMTLPIAGLLAYGGPVAAAVLRIKRGRRLPDLWPLAADLAALAARLRGDEDAPTLVAVAPHLGRLRDRGLHLPDLLTEAIAGKTAWPRRFALRREDDGEVRRTDRAALPRFTAAPGRGRPALVVDDVVTTGQTVQAAAIALQSAGWRVLGAVCLADARPQALEAADTA